MAGFAYASDRRSAGNPNGDEVTWLNPRFGFVHVSKIDPDVVAAAVDVGLAITGPGRGGTALLTTWAERVGLTPDLLLRYPHEVSDGQLQRACLARTLILKPRYLICDELGSMLDISTQAALLQTIALTPHQ